MNISILLLLLAGKCKIPPWNQAWQKCCCRSRLRKCRYWL